MSLSFENVQQAYKRIEPYIHKTPVVTNHALDAKVNEACGTKDKKIFLKCENLQKTGSFKPRGILNTVFHLKDEGKCAGVITHSSGNAGCALAWAASQVGFPCTVVTPKDSPKVKSEAMRTYGADVVYCEPNPTSRIETTKKIAGEKNYTIVHSYDQETLIAGQGTIALEFLEQVPELDAVFCSVGGGGMLAGVALATKAIKGSCKVFAVEPKGKDLGKCLNAKERLWTNPPQFVDTVADGLRNQQLGKLNFPIAVKNVEQHVFTVNDEEIISAMKFMMMRTKMMVETSAAITVAALFQEDMKKLDADIKNIGVVVCGGNVDLDKLPWVTSYYD